MKRFVSVITRVNVEGESTPLVIIIGNNSYMIDDVTGIEYERKNAVGDSRTKYTVRINGSKTHLFLDEGRWFVSYKEKYS